MPPLQSKFRKDIRKKYDVDRDLECLAISILSVFSDLTVHYFTDVRTAVIAKEALEGHCIYDGGFCKLHLAYSRHTDLSVKVNTFLSRAMFQSAKLLMLVIFPSRMSCISLERVLVVLFADLYLLTSFILYDMH